MRKGGAPDFAPTALHGALWAFSSGLEALYSASHFGVSPSVVNSPRGSIQNCRAFELPANSEDCVASMPITNVRVREAASTWAVSVVASRASWEAGTALRTARSYQESATIPCCAGQAPVAKVAIVEAEKVLARWRQSGKCAPFDKIFRRPPGPNWAAAESQ